MRVYLSVKDGRPILLDKKASGRSVGQAIITDGVFIGVIPNMFNARRLYNKCNSRLEYDGSVISLYRKEPLHDDVLGLCEAYWFGVRRNELYKAVAFSTNGICVIRERGHEHTFTVFEAIAILMQL